MMENAKPSVTIIGTGALGSTLQIFFRENGYLLRSAWNSQGGYIYSEGSEELQKTNSVPIKDDEIGDLIFITTPDDIINKIAQSLSEQPISWGEKTVVHCSGNITSDELSALSDKGAKVVSMHPLQTFKEGDGSNRLEYITISLQGDQEAQEQLKPLIKEMGANSILLDKKQKRYLHIAAVMASNYSVALMYSVENLLKDVELNEGFDALETLMHQTVTNIFEKGPANALTGPISRGDSESVQTHLSELKGRDQEIVYKFLGLEALRIAENSGNLTKSDVERLKKILDF